MEGYIYSRSSFSLLLRAIATAWDLPLEGYQAVSGTVTMIGELPESIKDSWLIFDGIWLIDRVEPGGGMTTLTVLPGIDAFNRPVLFPASPPDSVGGLIAQTLQKHFQSPSDSVYAMPYIDLVNTDSTPLVVPELSEAGLWTLSGYIRSAQDMVRVRLAVAGRLLRVQIEHAEPEMHKVTMDGATELLQQTYSREFTAKVTVVQGAAVTDFYVDENGVAGLVPPSPRLAGEWQVIEARDNKDPLEAAQEAFSKNVAANKVSFAAPARYQLGDTIRTRLGGRQADLKITAVRKASSDSRYVYSCGELRTSLSERLKASESISALGGISDKGGSVDGNLGIKGRLVAGDGMTVIGETSVAGLRTGGVIGLSAESYGTSLPTDNLFEGRFFILLED